MVAQVSAGVQRWQTEDPPVQDDTVLVTFDDLHLTRIARDRVLLGNGTASIAVAADESAYHELCALLFDVLPKFCTPQRPSACLRPDEAQLLHRYGTLLRRLHALAEPSEQTSARLTDAKRRTLYGYLARRTGDPDAALLAVEEQPIAIHGPEPWVSHLAGAVAAQGLSVAEAQEWRPESGPPSELPDGIVVAVTASVSEDLDSLSALVDVNRQFIEGDQRWVPAVVSPRAIGLGPWVSPRRSACVQCLLTGALLGRDVLSPTGAGLDETGPLSPQRGSPWATWTSARPAALSWMGGVLAHLLLRAALPVGGQHPWGRLVTLGLDTADQHVVSVWRDPRCAHCATVAGRAESWDDTPSGGDR